MSFFETFSHSQSSLARTLRIDRGNSDDCSVLSVWHRQPGKASLFDFLNETTKDKQMFNKFSDKAFRVIEVESEQFELISNQSLNTLFVPIDTHKVDENIVIKCGDAALIAEINDIYPSEVNSYKEIIVFYTSDFK